MLCSNSYLFLNIASLLFTSIIFYFYYKKNKINDYKSKIYFKLEIVLIISLILEIISSTNINYSFLVIIKKAVMVTIYIWIFLYLEYNILIISGKKLKNKTKLLLNTIKIFLISLIILLPLNIKISNICNNSSYGIGSSIFLISLILISFIITLYLIIDLKSGFNEKSHKMIIFNFLIVIIEFIQIINSEITMLNLGLSIIMTIIYFLFEDPNLKVINELNFAYQQMDKANRVKTEFLSSMSHEIRTPLNSIIGFSECILQEDNLKAIKKDTQNILYSSQNLLDSVNGIIDISMIEAGKMEISLKEYNIRKEIQELFNLIKNRSINKELNFKFSTTNNVPEYLLGDIDKIKTIVTNLLTNAIKYTDSGTITLKIDANCEKNNCHLIISVKDTGCGIKTENIKKIFNKFKKVEKDINSATNGVGLGLAITKSLVNMLGGTIKVISTYGKGSEFIVSLKQKIIISEKPTFNITNINVDDNRTFPNKKVLVVDDNKLNLKVATRIMNKYGIIIDTCENGIECLQKVHTYNYDLIFIDDMMPEMSGVDTFKQLKKINNFHTPVISFTANAVSGMRDYYLNLGFNDYLTKPIDKRELTRILNNYLK